MALPLSAILAIYWPGQGFVTEDDDAAGRGRITFWAKENTLPEPSVEEVRAREADAVAVIAEQQKERGKLDDLTGPVLLRFARAVGAALFDLRAGISAQTRQQLLDVKAEIDAILDR